MWTATRTRTRISNAITGLTRIASQRDQVQEGVISRLLHGIAPLVCHSAPTIRIAERALLVVRSCPGRAGQVGVPPDLLNLPGQPADLTTLAMSGASVA